MDAHYEYVVEPDINLICSICQGPFEDPVTTSGCRHTFCRACIDAALNSHPSCPLDRSRLTRSDLVDSGPAFQMILDDLRVRCLAPGCGQVYERSLQVSHQATCSLVVVHCPNEGCQQSMQRAKLPRHLTVMCPMKKMQCEVCQETITQANVFIHLHTTSGSAARHDVKCSFCGESVVKEGASLHRWRCPKTLVSCPHARHGCPAAMPRDTLGKHVDTCPYVHFAKFITETNRRITTLENRPLQQAHQLVRVGRRLEFVADRVTRLWDLLGPAADSNQEMRARLDAADPVSWQPPSEPRRPLEPRAPQFDSAVPPELPNEVSGASLLEDEPSASEGSDSEDDSAPDGVSAQGVLISVTEASADAILRSAAPRGEQARTRTITEMHSRPDLIESSSPHVRAPQAPAPIPTSRAPPMAQPSNPRSHHHHHPDHGRRHHGAPRAIAHGHRQEGMDRQAVANQGRALGAARGEEINRRQQANLNNPRGTESLRLSPTPGTRVLGLRGGWSGAPQPTGPFTESSARPQAPLVFGGPLPPAPAEMAGLFTYGRAIPRGSRPLDLDNESVSSRRRRIGGAIDVAALQSSNISANAGTTVARDTGLMTGCLHSVEPNSGRSASFDESNDAAPIASFTDGADVPSVDEPTDEQRPLVGAIASTTQRGDSSGQYDTSGLANPSRETGTATAAAGGGQTRSPEDWVHLGGSREADDTRNVADGGSRDAHEDVESYQGYQEYTGASRPSYPGNRTSTGSRSSQPFADIALSRLGYPSNPADPSGPEEVDDQLGELRSVVYRLAEGMDTMERQSQARIYTENLRVQEEVNSLRAIVHVMRNQVMTSNNQTAFTSPVPAIPTTPSSTTSATPTAMPSPETNVRESIAFSSQHADLDGPGDTSSISSLITANPIRQQRGSLFSRRHGTPMGIPPDLNDGAPTVRVQVLRNIPRMESSERSPRQRNSVLDMLHFRGSRSSRHSASQ